MLPAQRRLDLRWLTPILPEETILDTLATVRKHASVYERDETLAAIEARLPADQIDRALAASQRIDHAKYGATALAILAPHRLNVEQMGLAIGEINFLMDDSLRASVLLGLVPHVSPAQIAQILGWLGVLHTESQAAVLLAVAPRLPSNLLSQAMAHIAGLRDDGLKEQIVAALAATHLADATPQILSSFLLVNKQLSLGNLEAIMPHLPAARHPALLDLIKAMPDERLRGKALRILAPQLAANLLPRAVKLANAITDQIGRALALAALALRLPDAEQQRVLAAAVKAAKAAADDPERMSRARSIQESLNAEHDLGRAIPDERDHMADKHSRCAV